MNLEQTASFSVKAHKNRQTLRLRRKLLDLVLIIFILGNFGLMSQALEKSARDAETINIAGRQRSLSQRIGLLVSQLDKSPDTASRVAILAELRLELDTLRDNHATLLDRANPNDATALTPWVNNRIFDVDDLNKRLSTFEQLVESVLELTKTQPDDSDASQQTRHEIQSIALRSLEDPDSLLHAQNDLVTLYELAFGERIERTQRILLWITVLALALSVVALVFVFNPALRQSEENLLTMERERRRLIESTQRSINHLREIIDDAQHAISQQKSRTMQSSASDPLQLLLGELEQQVNELDDISNNDSDPSGCDIFSVASMVDQAIANQLKRDIAEGIQIERFVEQDRTVTANLRVLRGSLEYLIANAMIFKDPSELVPMVNIYVEFPDASTCAITVRDNGIGVAIEERDKLFVPRSNERGFTGVGLSVVRQNLQTCGATISYTPAIGGSCFEIRFRFEPGTSLAA